MARFAMASSNPVKVRAMLTALAKVFPHERHEVLPCTVDSGVSAQPFSDQETLQGAWQRLSAVALQYPDCDGWAAIEGGVEEGPEGLRGLAWIVVRTRTASGQARSATFPLPPALADCVRRGIELGLACDQLYGRTNTKQGGGAIALLTDGLIDRHALYEHAAIMALIPCKR